MLRRRLSQKQKILTYLREHDGITPKDAERNGINSMRLAARISDLQKDGHEIAREMETHLNADGTASRYARYRLEGE